MPDPAPQLKKPRNPLYVVLLAVSTLFVITAMAYLMGPFAQQRVAEGMHEGAGSKAMAAWLDRNGPTALGIELAVMIVTGTLAMFAEQKNSPRRGQ